MKDCYNINNDIYEKKQTAAMFGLDARIALAIFAALSVITGAALYRTVQESKAVALLTEMQEIGKAFEQYYLTTGVYPEKAAALPNINFYNYKTSQLIDNTNNVSNWRGPYVPYGLGTGPDYLGHPKYRNIQIIQMTDEDGVWGDGAGKWDAGVCNTAGQNCYATIMLNGIPDDSLAKVIDKKVDGGDGGASGKFRWWTDGANAGKYRYHLIYMPVKNPSD